MVRRNNHTPNSRSLEGARRELDSRESDGLHIRLLWHPASGRVSVAVNDSKTGTSFDVVVRSGQRALDVFHHPFAYTSSTLKFGSRDHEAAAARPPYANGRGT
jgi:hypothetical protein